MNKLSLITGFKDVFSSLWLIVDMVTDILAIMDYHEKKESVFFLASLIACLLPIIIATVITCICFAVKVDGKLSEGCLAVFVFSIGLFCVISFLSWIFRADNYNPTLEGTDLSKFPAWVHGLFPCVLIYGLPLGIIVGLLSAFWVFSPVLHIIQALFSLFGIRPSGGVSSQIQGNKFNKFWLLVLILQIVEQFLEALPSLVINTIYVNNNWDKVDNLAVTVGSCVFSAGSLFLFIAGNVYKCALDYENSIIGLYNSS